MKKFFSYTLGGISRVYYIRNLLFGLMFPLILFLIPSADTTGEKAVPIEIVFIFTIYTFLYPYSRLVYETLVDFILGDNVFFLGGILAPMIKIVTMVLCWAFAIFIAPIGLAYIFYTINKDEGYFS